MSSSGGIPLLDLNRQTERLSAQLERAARQVLRRGQFILGPEVGYFEREFARSCGTRFGIGVASGTDALELALRALGIGRGDLVAIPAMTFLATADAVLHVGARPLFVDIDPLTFTLAPSDLERRIRRLAASDRKRLKAVIPVHLYGHPCDMDAIGRVAGRYRLAVIEDAAQAAGAEWRRRPAGSFGAAGCFSFFPSKNLGAFGDAGMVVTSSPRLHRLFRSLRVHGRGQGDLQERLGRNSRLDELQAALLRVKLRHLKEWVASRRKLARAYTARLSALSSIGCPVEAPGAQHAFHLYVIRSPRRDRIQASLGKRGISSRVYYPVPLHRQPLYRSHRVPGGLPETDRACREVLALPLFPEMRMDELSRVCAAVARAV